MCALLIGAQACREVPTAGLPENVEVRLLNPAAWPGSDLIIVSSALTGATALPEVMLDTFRLAVARVGDSTVTARLPDSSGTFAIHVRLQGGDRYGSVRIVGFVRHTDAIPLTGWPLSAWPGSPIMMVATESSLVKLDLRSGMATSHWNIPHWGGCSVSPGPSFRQGGVVAQGRSRTAPNSCERALTWLGAVPVDSAPFVAGNRLWAELSPDTWLFAAHHDMWIYRSGQLVASETME